MTHLDDDGNHVRLDEKVEALTGWKDLVDQVSARMGIGQDEARALFTIMGLQAVANAVWEQTQALAAQNERVSPVIDRMREEIEKEDGEDWRG